MRIVDDRAYGRWLAEECACAVCGKRPCQAHHEPPIGMGGGDTRYWKRAVPLCAECHRKRHDTALFGIADRTVLEELAKHKYPAMYLEERKETYGLKRNAER